MKKSIKALTGFALLAGALLMTIPALASTKTWSAGGGANTNWSVAANWSPSAAGAGDDLHFTNNPSAAFTNTVDSGFTSTIRSLSFDQTNGTFGLNVGANGLNINSTFSSAAGVGAINALTVGNPGDGVVNANITTVKVSGTSLSVNNPNAPIVVRMTRTGSSSTTSRGLLDMTGLNSFTANVSGIFTGWENYGGAVNLRPLGTILYAKTNTITCTANGQSSGIGYVVGDVIQNAASASGSTNRLGQVNTINVNSMRIGGAKSPNVYFDFNPAFSNSTATFRNALGTGRQTTWYIGDDVTSGSASGGSAIMDLSGGTVDAQVGTIYVGRGQSASGTGDGVGTLVMKAGTIDVDTMEVGYQNVTGDSVGRGTLKVNGGTLKVNKNLRLARSFAGSTDTGSGQLIINSGTVTVAGNFLNGPGTNILTVTNNGVLNLQPAGDLTAGSISVNTLNLGAGSVTNYSALNVGNINILPPASQFTVYPGQTLSPVGQGVGGLLSVNTNLVLNNASVTFDLGTGTSDQIAVLGAMTLQGTNSVLVNPLAGFGTGTYTIMTYGSGLVGDINTKLKLGGSIADSRYTLSLDSNTVPNINLNVSGGPAASLTWSGNGSGNVWDLKNTLNWNAGSGANTEKFYSLDTVLFDDTGSALPAVNLVGSLLPGSVMINGTNNYTFNGTGKISGGNGLTMNGNGTLLLLTTNDYSDVTTINSGTVQLGNGTTADGGLGITPINNNGALIFNSAGNQVIVGSISGSGSIVKRGPGITQLAGDNSFSYALTNEAGTLMAGSATAFGDTAYGTTINSGASLDLGGQIIGAEAFTVSGSGIGGAGAIINSGTVAGTLQNLALVGDTTFGGSSTWSIYPLSGGSGLQANTNKITKLGSNSVQFGNDDSSFIADGGLGDLDIQAGNFTFYGYVSLGDPTKSILVRSNATLQLNNTGDSLTSKNIVLADGATLVSTLPNRLRPQYCTVPGPITLGGADTFNVVANDRVVLNGLVTGSGSLIANGAGTIVFGSSNTFTGDLNIQSGTVVLTNNASVSTAGNIILSSSTLDVSGRSDSTLTLASGQTLKGSGNIVGNISSPTGATIAPGATIGTITATGNITMRGTTTMDINKTGALLTSDQIVATGTIDLGGTLTVTAMGSLTNGDTFALFTGPLANAFTTVNLPAGYTWTNTTAIDGTIQVLAVATATPPVLGAVTRQPDGNFSLLFSGPASFGYSVRATTNLLTPLAGWTVLGTGTFGGVGASYLDLTATNYPQRFYRVTIP